MTSRLHCISERGDCGADTRRADTGRQGHRHLTIDDLAPVDESTPAAALRPEELAGLWPHLPPIAFSTSARGLAVRRAIWRRPVYSRVSGSDLTPEFVETGHGPDGGAGLSDRVDFRVGSALDIPFPDGTFDCAWSQNRGDEYRRPAALLRPRCIACCARRTVGDPGRGGGQRRSLNVRLMWADRPDISSLRTPEETKILLEAAGFRIEEWSTTPRQRSPRLRPNGPRRGQSPPIRRSLAFMSWWDRVSGRDAECGASMAEGRTR